MRAEKRLLQQWQLILSRRFYSIWHFPGKLLYQRHTSVKRFVTVSSAYKNKLISYPDQILFLENLDFNVTFLATIVPSPLPYQTARAKRGILEPDTSTGRLETALMLNSAIEAQVEGGIVRELSTTAWPQSWLKYSVSISTQVESAIVRVLSTTGWPQSSLVFSVTIAAQVESGIVRVPSTTGWPPSCLVC